MVSALNVRALSETAVAHIGLIRLAPGVRARHALTYLWAAFVSIGVFGYFVAMQPYLLAVNLHIPPEQQGGVSGDLQFWQEIAALPLIGFIGALSDRTGRRIVYTFGWLVMALAFAVAPFANDYAQLLGGRLIFAVAVATLGAMLQVVLADYPVEQDRGKLAGLAVVLNSLGFLLFLSVLTRLPATFRNAGLSEVWAGRATFWCIGGVCVVSALLMWGLRPGLPYHLARGSRLASAAASPTIRHLMAQGLAAGRHPRIALAYASSFMARADLVIVALFLALWAQLAAQADGFTAADAAKHQGLLFAIVQGSALLWAPLFGWLADRLDRVSLVTLAIALSIVGYGWIGFIDNPLHRSAFPAAVTLGIGQTSGVLAVQVLVGEEAPQAIRGSVVGMVVLFGALGILVISKLGGYAFDHWRPGAPFLIMAAANVPLLLFALYVRVRAPRSTRF